MSSKQHETIYLEDYQPPAWLISHTELRFELEEEQTLVRAQLSVQANPLVSDKRRPLELFGDVDMELCRLSIDGEILEACDYQRKGDRLLIENVPESFTLECVTRLLPHENTALEGLYKSDGMFCTQCEAEGFRRITFFPDRPDVMSIFRTTLVADKALYPVLLSNGNPIESGEDGEGRHWVTWDDPWPKPSYLFALVAGDLAMLEDRYTTTSGREVALRIYAEPKDLDKLDYAMQSLKNAMRWDEDVYGREYDLDIYMIVAVDFFNMGAMENKGLNIFNTSCVLAHPKTTTDQGFQRVEGVVAHEYFHNWSGNRVTCRDWFQLSLKEGFTVFRDAEFSADMNSRTVKRIEDVSLLRTAQFAEDAGPMAHPVRPESYMEISNFYTLTVYEKGAEVVRMLHTLLGADLFRKGSDLYFERHDGQAVTTDDFVAAMEAVSGRDLGQFKRWYSQAGTPRLEVSDSYNPETCEYTLTVRQSCPPSPGQDHKQPYLIPLNIGLLAEDGQELYSGMLELTKEIQQFRFDNIASRPVPSLLRGFSAPVKLEYDYSDEQLLMLLSNDPDGFNRWDAGQRLCIRLLQQQMQRYRDGVPMTCPETLVTAWRQLLLDESLDPAMVTQCLRLPSEAQLAELAGVIDVAAIHDAREFMRKALAEALEQEWLMAYQRCDTGEAYSPDAESTGRRSLKNLALAYLMATGREPWLELTRQQYEQSDNMTDQLAALSLVAHSEFRETAEELLQEFYQQWQHESLVMNQWLAVQASDPTEGALERVKELAQHPIFDARNPNKLRSLIGSFCAQNLSSFHAEDGSGYIWLADWILKLDKQNPQVAARLLTPLTRWKRYTAERGSLMRAQLQRIIDTNELSADVYEVVSKSLI
ncbi:aminopeptidase N [Marinobacterium sediminicola]|uniref:Aminopeptidase N n=1 Tax=Marinobacterium sediminicola TaxID=518898 RepID=A0ABY1RWX3_9GAMM|nr:aminopeptidase N [Marinobacterium sediminicola]ULG67960.1 aminopeptidase N [Marinobacterium sediminicola]SMR71304.1 aminopeptidase N [Marinobacterium sediminicola]